MTKDGQLYVDIDAHSQEHTAVVAKRFGEEEGSLGFENRRKGINQFLWLKRKLEKREKKFHLGGVRERFKDKSYSLAVAR